MNLKRDLHDYADKPDEYDKIIHSRIDLIERLLPDGAEIEHYRQRGYQGKMGIVVWVDEYTWVIKESFGSCAYCDGLLAADDPVEYGMSMLRDAYAFETDDDAVEFVQQKLDDEVYMWNNIGREIIRILE